MNVRKKSISPTKAIQAIEKYGILLVYPIQNREEPKSLWSVFYPDEEMRWEWDDEGDDRVANLWHLKTELGVSREVVYAKWYQGRATFFSRDVFRALLAVFGTPKLSRTQLRRESAQILEVLEMDSPQSTKQIKLATELRGKTFERVYEKAMKELWARLWIVGFGEVEDGAFPSLAVGASQTLFEDLWDEAKNISPREAKQFLIEKLGEDSLFWSKGVLKNSLETPSISTTLKSDQKNL